MHEHVNERTTFHCVGVKGRGWGGEGGVRLFGHHYLFHLKRITENKFAAINILHYFQPWGALYIDSRSLGGTSLASEYPELHYHVAWYPNHSPMSVVMCHG